MKPNEMYSQAVQLADKKAKTPGVKLFFLAILGGLFIAIGGMFAAVAASQGSMLPVGVDKILMGLCFSVGLILVVVGGGEIFTGATLVILSVVRKSVSIVSMMKNWIIVYLGNIVGSLILVFLVIAGKQYMFAGGEFGKAILSITAHKLALMPLQAVALGIVCNILVCLAIWLTYSAETTSGKIMAILWPITAFVAGGFEHSVANMYLIPVGILIKTFDPQFVAKIGVDVTNFTWSNFVFGNLIWVTIGNIIGGIFVWMIYYAIFNNSEKNA